MKQIRFHKKVQLAIDVLDVFTKSQLADQFQFLAMGVNLGMPISRPMPMVSHGVHELRIRSKNGQYRIFYFTKLRDAVLVFHMFKKKTQQTPGHEITVAKRRLGEML